MIAFTGAIHSCYDSRAGWRVNDFLIASTAYHCPTDVDSFTGEYQHSHFQIIPFPRAVKTQHRHPPLFKAPSLPPKPSFLHYPPYSIHLPSLYIYIFPSQLLQLYMLMHMRIPDGVTGGSTTSFALTDKETPRRGHLTATGLRLHLSPLPGTIC